MVNVHYRFVPCGRMKDVQCTVRFVPTYVVYTNEVKH